MRRALVCLFLLVACGDDDDSEGDPDGGGGGADGAADSDAPPGDTYPKACSDLYDPEALPTFAIEIADEEWAAIQSEYESWEERIEMGLDPKVYHPLISFRYGDEVVTDAQIRLKGSPQFSWNQPKMNFVISFNESNPNGRFHGQRKLNLDAARYDEPYLRYRVALSYLGDLGVPAMCANNARLDVNGTFYGLYQNIEHMDKEYLQRLFPDAEADGNLYKDGIEKDTNEENPDTSDLQAWMSTYDLAGLDAIADMDEILLAWAGEAVVIQCDGYLFGGTNYFLYNHPTRGFLWLSWDLDFAMDTCGADVDPITFRVSWADPSPHFHMMMRDADGRARFLQALRRARDAWNPDVLQARVDAWSAQIMSSAMEDTRSYFSYEEHLAAVASLRQFLADRATFLDTWLACAEGLPADNSDSDAQPWCLDCDDSDPTRFVGNPENCTNNLDDDCSGFEDDCY